MGKKKPQAIRPGANPSFEAMEETIGAAEVTLIINQSPESMACNKSSVKIVAVQHFFVTRVFQCAYLRLVS
jgi:hypothetical protein